MIARNKSCRRRNQGARRWVSERRSMKPVANDDVNVLVGITFGTFSKSSALA
jgi:hypothetical protein